MPITVLIIFVINFVALFEYFWASTSFIVDTAYPSLVLSNSLLLIRTSPNTRIHNYGAVHTTTLHTALHFHVHQCSYMFYLKIRVIIKHPKLKCGVSIRDKLVSHSCQFMVILLVWLVSFM